MAFFITLLLWAALFVAQQLLMPDPDVEDARAPSLDNFNFPTATEGRIIPLLWGTDDVKGPNVIWYGNLDVRPIIELIKVSMFKKKAFIKGYRYFVGIQFGICQGPATLRRIWVGDEVVWTGTQSTDGDITINSEFAQGTFTYYTGSLTQIIDPYLNTHQTPSTAYRGVAYGIFKDGFVGESTSVKPWRFEVERIPTGLSIVGGDSVNTDDANPMNVVYEILSDDYWGYGYADADIDKVALADAGNTLRQEGNGFSMMLGNQQDANKILDEIEKQCDCRFRLDTTTGKFTVALIRDGYSLSGLKDADQSTILELMEYSRGTWEGTQNHIRVQYKRRSVDYTTGYATAQDMANIFAQNRTTPATYNFPGVRDDDLANDLAWREIRSNSYPLAKMRAKVNRTFWNAFVGEAILFSWTAGTTTVTDLPMRIIKIDLGSPEDREITIDAVQDVFTFRSPSFASPDATSWVAPDRSLVPFIAAEQIAFETPYAFVRRTVSALENTIFCAGVSPGRKESGADIMQRNGASDPGAGDFTLAGQLGGFMFVGTLVADITPDDVTIDVTTSINVAEFVDVTAFEVGNELSNIALIGDEFVACRSASTISGGVKIENTYRGLLDSAQKAHSLGDPVYFLFSGGDGVSDTAFTPGYFIDVRLLPYRDSDATAIAIGDGGVTEMEIETVFRQRRPYPPTEMTLNASAYPTGDVDLDVDSASSEDTKGVDVDYNRRDWRILDEVPQLSVDASTINGDFPANNTTEYRLRVYNDPDGANTLLFTTAFADQSSIFASRTKILRYTVGVVPSRLRASITCRHTDDLSAVREALQDLYYDFDSASAELAPDNNWGVQSSADTYTSDWTAPDTGDYPFKLGTSGPSVWASVNGGAEQEIITAASTTGTLTGVTASDTIKIKYKGTVTGDETIVLVESPVDAEDSYVIFV